jgi:processing peptidase subunit alpha
MLRPTPSLARSLLPLSVASSSTSRVVPALSALTRKASTSTPTFPPTSTVTTLPNRLRVVTEPSPGHFHAVGVYVDAGSRYETQRNSGVSHLLDRLAFKVGSSAPRPRLTELICFRAPTGIVMSK